jgi:DnaK suppressor protein
MGAISSFVPFSPEMTMGSQAPRFSAEYLDHKRRELVRLREQLRSTSDATETEETEIKDEAVSQVQEYEDDAQRLDQLEIDGNLVGRDVARLARVARALEKITEGTYGLSDVSGKQIPEQRLEVMPDAINTVD